LIFINSYERHFYLFIALNRINTGTKQRQNYEETNDNAFYVQWFLDKIPFILTEAPKNV